MQKYGVWWIVVSAIVVIVLLRTTNQENQAVGSGTSYYVDSVGGSDSNSGTSETVAWKSLEMVNNRNFLPGDVIYLKKGSYWEGTGRALEFTESGTASSPILITTYGSGAMPELRASGTWSSTIRLRGDYLIVDGLKVTGGHEAGFMIHTGADHCTVKNGEATDVGVGVSVNGDYSLITNNYIHDLNIVVSTVGGVEDWGAVGIWIYSNNNEVSYNRIINAKAFCYDFGMDGGVFEFYSDTSNNYLHHNYGAGSAQTFEVGGGLAQNNIMAYNVFYNNGGIGGIHLTGTFAGSVSNFRFEHNTVIEPYSTNRINWWNGIPTTSTFQVKNNIFYLNTASYVWSTNGGQFIHEDNIYHLINPSGVLGTPLGVGEMMADPLFVDLSAGNYHLQSTSPAIDAAQPLGQTLDYDNNPVPHGSYPDIGAYEYIGAVSQCNTNADTNCDGIVSRPELGVAIDKWISGQISRQELGNDIQAWVGG